MQNIQHYCNQLKYQLYRHCTEHAEMTGAACIEDKVILSHLCYQSSADWRNEAAHGEELVAQCFGRYMHANRLPDGCTPKPLLTSLNHQGKVLVEAEQNEMKINMAEQRLQARTRYHSPWWKTHHKLQQIILWNYGKKWFHTPTEKIGQLIYVSINYVCMCAMRLGDLCMCLLGVLVCIYLFI